MKRWSPYMFVAGLFLLLACPSMLTTGMFMDGLIYSSIAKNMTLGIGSFWHPSYTLTQFTQFYEHPPLMMWLLSLWMRLLGANMMAAKLYSIAVVAICAALVVLIWSRLRADWRSTAWLPLLLCTATPPLVNHANNNILECTMAIFVLSSVALMLGRRQTVLRHIGAGLLLALAFLTKGFTGLFPLALPALLWLFKAQPQRNLWQTIGLTAVAAAATITPIAAVMILNADAHDFIVTYFYNQVVNGSNTKIVDSRLYIVGRYWVHTAALWLVTLLTLWLGRRSQKPELAPTQVLKQNRTALALLALSLCGVLPMMVSTKQRDFYMVAALPFSAIGLAAIAAPYVACTCQWVRGKAVAIIATVLLTVAVAANAAMCGKPGRDRALQTDMDVIATHLTEGETVTIPDPLTDLYKLHGYYYLNHRVSLDQHNAHRYLLTTTQLGLREWEGQYREIELPTSEYKLYEKL